MDIYLNGFFLIFIVLARNIVLCFLSIGFSLTLNDQILFQIRLFISNTMCQNDSEMYTVKKNCKFTICLQFKYKGFTALRIVKKILYLLYWQNSLEKYKKKC